MLTVHSSSVARRALSPWGGVKMGLTIGDNPCGAVTSEGWHGADPEDGAPIGGKAGMPAKDGGP